MKTAIKWGRTTDGLRMLKELKPDIVITDIRMPKMDGLEMMTNAVKDGITARAILLSAYSEFEYARQAMKLGLEDRSGSGRGRTLQKK